MIPKKYAKRKWAACFTALLSAVMFTFPAAGMEAYTDRLSGIANFDFPMEHEITRGEFFTILADLFPDHYVEVTGNPGDLLNRQDALALMGALFDKDSDMRLDFADAAGIADYAYAHVAWFAERGIIVGNTDGTFAPRRNIIAAEFAVIGTLTYDFLRLNQPQVAGLSGTGVPGHTDGAAARARYNLPHGMVVGNDGSLIVFDTFNNLIRRESFGNISTLSGNVLGTDDNRFPRGFYLDGDIEKALFNRPSGGVINSRGDLLIADSGNNAIRIIRGEGVFTWSGGARGYADGPGREAKFNSPMAIAVDQYDNIYVADTLNNCIRKIDAGGTVTTVAGVPGQEGYADGAGYAALFRQPMGIAVSWDGSVIYVSDTGNHRIRKIEDGYVTTLAGHTTDADAEGSPFGGFKDGPGQTAMFSLPMGLALAGGVLVVADSANNRIRAVSPGGYVSTVAGDGEPGDIDGDAQSARLHQPRGVCLHDGTLYIADTSNNKIKIMTFYAEMYR